jgi:hypothetical protein
MRLIYKNIQKLTIVGEIGDLFTEIIIAKNGQYDHLSPENFDHSLLELKP